MRWIRLLAATVGMVAVLVALAVVLLARRGRVPLDGPATDCDDRPDRSHAR